MSKKVTGLFIFALGASIGSLVTYKVVSSKYKQIAQEEIDSVKEVFLNRIREELTNSNVESKGTVEKQESKAKKAKDKPNIIEYATILKDMNYSSFSNDDDEEMEAEEYMNNEPYVIAPEELGEVDNYEVISLTYYSDEVLTDDNDDIIEDVEDVVGTDALSSFGDYEDDSVFVRNDRLQCDFEILADERAYADIIDRKPHEVDE